VLELEGLQHSKHSGVLALFRQKYVKTGLVEAEFSDVYGRAFDSRNWGDYEREKFPDRVNVERTLAGADRFVERIEQLIAELKS